MFWLVSWFVLFIAVTGRDQTVEENPEITESKPGVMRSESVNDQPSPRGVLEIPVMGSDSDTSSCSSSSSNSSSYHSLKKPVSQKLNRDSYGWQWKNIIETIRKKSTRRFSVIPLLTSYDVSRKNWRKKLLKLYGSEEEEEEGVDIDCIPMAKPSWKNFSYSELAAATDDFSPGKQFYYIL